MQATKSNYLFLWVCLAEAALLLLAQATGAMALLAPCIMFFLAFVAWSVFQGTALPVLLFFLPFAPLMKFEPGTVSFFTVALLAAYLVSLLKGIQNVNVSHFVPGLLVIAFSLLIKMLYGYQIDNSFILFSASLLLIPMVSQELGKEYDFYALTLFFSLGITVAAITSLYMTSFSNVVRFVTVHEAYGSIRLSGYYGDPNFYAAHISAALGGFMVLLLTGTDKRKNTFCVLMAVILSFCGILSVSKAFMLLAAILLFLFSIEVMLRRGRLSTKLLLFFSIAVGIGFLLSSSVFLDAFNVLLSRFGEGKTLSDITTGRTDLWLRYLQAFRDDPLLLFFGNGFSDVRIGVKNSHNTILQAIYQFGLVGCVFLGAWLFCFLRGMLSKGVVKRSNSIFVGILLIGAIGPWMALDLLFFDEFFLIPMYVCAGIAFLAQEKAEVLE